MRVLLSVIGHHIIGKHFTHHVLHLGARHVWPFDQKLCELRSYLVIFYDLLSLYLLQFVHYVLVNGVFANLLLEVLYLHSVQLSQGILLIMFHIRPVRSTHSERSHAHIR